MTTIHLQKKHQLGLAKAREVAWTWAEKAEKKLAMRCHYEEGDDFDCVAFKRSGVTGELLVHADYFEITAKLGLMLSPFKAQIEAEILQQLGEQ
jgi:putative polyhydroxyalkanoate system protein